MPNGNLEALEGVIHHLNASYCDFDFALVLASCITELKLVCLHFLSRFCEISSLILSRNLARFHLISKSAIIMLI